MYIFEGILQYRLFIHALLIVALLLRSNDFVSIFKGMLQCHAMSALTFYYLGTEVHEIGTKKAVASA